MKIKQLLLTTDFSENARKTYSCATALARKFDATLHLAHFAGVAPAMMLGSSDECYYETRRKALQLEAKEHPVLEGYGVLPHLEAYRWTPERLRSLEQAHDIDLVVMGTHGRTGGRYFGSILKLRPL